jgi:Peptidase family M28
MRSLVWLPALALLAACNTKDAGGAGPSQNFVDAGGGGGGGGGAAAATDPEIAGIVAGVSGSRMMGRITTLSGFTTRNTCSDDTSGGNMIGSARDWIQAQLKATAGLTVSLDPFAYAGCGTGPVTRENVVAVLPGAHPTRVIVVGGHYDSRTYNVTDGASRSPGANDSGSQTSLVLEAAQLLAGHTFDATILFAAFAGEEQGLVGSANLASTYAKYTAPGAVVEAMLNSDIVGGDSSVNNATTLQQFRLYSPGTPREIVTPLGTTDDTSPSRGVMRYVATWGAAYVPSMSIVPMLREDRPGRGGDHESFISAAHPGVRFIETVESPNAGQAGSHQHTLDDLTSYVTPDYAGRMASVVIAVAASLARAPGAPSGMTVTGSATSLALKWSPPATGQPVDHYVLAARSTAENFYRGRLLVPAGGTSATVGASDLGVADAPSFFVSVAAVDAAGHESLFAYPEYRCDPSGCVVPPAALDVTAKD